MRLRTITGKSISEALDRVHTELGPNALVLETRTEGGTTEVVAAEVEREAPEEGLMRLRAEVALLRRELGIRHGSAQPVLSGVPARASRAMTTTRGAATMREAEAPSRFQLVEERLTDQGMDPALVRRVLRMIQKAPAREGHPIDPLRGDYVLNATAGILPGAAVESGGARAFLFVGPPGAGKTTTVAKLAVQIAKGGNRSFGIITLDAEGPDIPDVLVRTAERLEVPYRRVRGPTEMAQALKDMADLRMLLIDTGPLSGREIRAIAELRESRSGKGQVTAHLVMPANLEPTSMRAIAESMLEMKPSAIVMTKIDETRKYGELINLPTALGLPVSALGHGRSIDGDLAPATRRLVAEIVLGRKSLKSGATRA